MTNSQVEALIDVLKEFQRYMNDMFFFFSIQMFLCLLLIIFLSFKVSKLNQKIQKLLPKEEK